MQEQLKAETHISEAAFRSLNLEKDEFKSKLQQTAEANNRTVQELRESQEQLQATIDGLTKTVEALNQTVQLLCKHSKEVSTCKVETVSTSKWTEIPPAINIANFRPNNIVWYTYSTSIIRACVAIFISRLCPIRSTPISYPFSTER